MSTGQKIAVVIGGLVVAFFALGAIHRASTPPEQRAIDQCMREAEAMTDPDARGFWLQRCEQLRQEWREKLLENSRSTQ